MRDGKMSIRKDEHLKRLAIRYWYCLISTEALHIQECDTVEVVLANRISSFLRHLP